MCTVGFVKVDFVKILDRYLNKNIRHLKDNTAQKIQKKEIFNNKFITES